jgi:hypothetical protein
MKPRKQQEDRLLKQLSFAERRRQVIIRRRIATDVVLAAQ